MNLKGSQTEKNLLLAYMGECNNRTLYACFAEQAREEGYDQVSAIFMETADHEYEHARQELKLIQTSDVEMPAMVYPVKGVDATLSNLETAISGEHYEQVTMYPDFAKTAQEENFPEIAQLFRDIATVEAYHERRFISLFHLVKNGKVFQRERMVIWKCGPCGYMKEDREAPQRCPICKRNRAFFQVLGEHDLA